MDRAGARGLDLPLRASRQHDVGGRMTVAYDLLAALDGSDQRLFVLTPADEATE